MMSLKVLLLIGVYLSLLQSALSNPAPLNETTMAPPEEEGCETGVTKIGFRSCIKSHYLPENETRQMYNESRCPFCAHICRSSQTILDCMGSAIDASVPCNKNVRDVGTQFFKDIFRSGVTYFCENDGDKLTTIDDSENMRCIVTKEGNCHVDIMNEKINKDGNDDSSSSESDEINEDLLCRRMITGLSCVSKKAEACNHETAAVITSFAEYAKRSPPCSKYFPES